MSIRRAIFKTSLGVSLAESAHIALANAQVSGQQALPSAASDATETSLQSLGANMSVGDIVFIQVSARPFREVALATNSWTNHVGIVIDTSGAEPLIGESTFPFSRTTRLSKFIVRSSGGRVAVARLNTI